ncbi:MAG: hypothetical protein S4CHLAM81_07320 [Chlamydiales bacterium]|nr:hypothetical protein [Chlamydiales bacterium]MCH9635516.1 hypothetical protein [Chlamydiales bacterium]MCH9703370.1 hypothetical protein [Chlamydiota bacterium]
MKLGLLIRIFICIAATAAFLYFYIEKQNRITQLRLEIPQLARQVELLRQEIVRVQFEVDQFENPVHLLELARKPEYGHLRQPKVNEIVTIQ